MWTGSSRGIEMWAWVRRVAIVACALLSIVSGAQAGARSKAEKQLEKLYPAGRFVTAIGMSEAGPEQAEAQARAEVSSQVRSELSAVLSTVEFSTQTNGRSTEYQRIEATTESRTSFKHGELIVNDRKLEGREGKAWLAVAVLDRDEAARVLEQEYQTHAIEFRAAAQELLRAESDLPTWTTTLRRAERSFAGLLEPVFAMRALRRAPRDFAADEELNQRVQTERGRRLSGVRMALRIDPTQEDAGPLVSSLGGALAQLGLESRSDGCPDDGYVLQITPAFNWETGMFGPVIRLSLPGRLVRCAGGQPVGQIMIKDSEFVGTDVRDRQRALAALWQQVNQVRLSVLLRSELARYLPVSRL